MPKVMLDPRRQAVGLHWQHINANLAGFISWKRLAQELRRSGEIKTGETVEAFVLNADGIQYFVEAEVTP